MLREDRGGHSGIRTDKIERAMAREDDRRRRQDRGFAFHMPDEMSHDEDEDEPGKPTTQTDRRGDADGA